MLLNRFFFGIEKGVLVSMYRPLLVEDLVVVLGYFKSSKTRELFHAITSSMETFSKPRYMNALKNW